MFETLKLIPAKILFLDGEVVGILAFGLGGLLWVIVPFLDRSSANRTRSRVVTALGLIVVLYIIAMTAHGYLA